MSSVILRAARVAAVAARGADEITICIGALLVVVGVALIYYPAAVIFGGLLLVLIGIGRLRA